MEKEKPWIGVDLDGTLAEYDGWKGIEHIGEPVMPMYLRVMTWLMEGKRVKIFTARVAHGPEAISYIRAWLDMHSLPEDLEITNIKDFAMIDLYDDRCANLGYFGKILGMKNYRWKCSPSNKICHRMIIGMIIGRNAHLSMPLFLAWEPCWFTPSCPERGSVSLKKGSFC